MSDKLENLWDKNRRDLFNKIYPIRSYSGDNAYIKAPADQYRIIERVCEHQLWTNSFSNAYMIQDAWKETQWT